MAPEGTSVGVVASPRAIAMAEHAWLDVRALLATAPELAPINAMLGAQLQQALGKADVTLADVGLTPTKGGAFFISPGGGGIAIVPVGDRDKFLAATHGTKGTDSDRIGQATCKTVSGVYVCARTPDMFAKIGKGSLRKGLDPVGTRGDLEIVTNLPLPGGQAMIGGVLQLARGTVVARAAITGVPEKITSRLGGTQIKARGDLDKTAGFGIVSLAPLLAGVPPLPLLAGVTLADLSKTISGPVTVHIPPGAPELDVRIPVNDPKPAATLIEHCTEIPPLAEAGATFSDGACHVNVPSVGYQLDFWVDGQEIRIGRKGAATGGIAVPMTAVGAEMARQESAFAFWGRGTLFGQAIANFPKLPAMPAELLMAIRGISMLNELGGTLRVERDKLMVTWVVRTAWSNPDDVVAKLVAINPQTFLDGKASEAAKTIADGAPTSPFAADFKAGTGGLMAPMAVIGMASAVAIPAFMDYMKKSKKTEVSLQLNKLGKEAKAYYVENAAFPIADAPLTPPASCCSTQGKCPPAGAGWLNEAWTKLDFQIDEPTLYQYRYHSDGKTFDAEAIGDLDCDGIEVTYKLHGEVDQGNPTMTITEPPPNTD
jgi:type II secretory pathway pseudopilin PulG